MREDTAAPAFQFRQLVHEGGYRWIETRPAFSQGGEGKPGRYLTSGTPLGVAYNAVGYSPLHPSMAALFRTFADLEPTEEAIQAFANEYGLLGDPVTTWIVLPMEGAASQTIGWGESLRGWTREIHAMRRAVKVWDAARSGDLDFLGSVIQWHPRGVRYEDGRYVEWLLTVDDPESTLWSRFRQGDVVMPAYEFVRRTITKHLEGRVSPRMLWEHDRDRITMRMVPHSLVGALWLQFARAVEARSEFGRCRACGKWFVYEPDTARTNRRYCSDACRFKAYRQRQKEAIDMFARGQSVEEIAEALDSTAETVRRWVQKGGLDDAPTRPR